MRLVLLASLIATLSACANAPPESSTLSAELVANDLADVWSNRAQYAAADPTLKVPPAIDGEWLDHQHARFTRVRAPALGDTVLYLEWRKADASGDISRQRIWSFHEREGELRMDFYAFIDGAPYAGKSHDPAAFASLDPTHLRGYGPACALRFVPTDSGWRGEISASDCTLIAASGRKMGIDARVERVGAALNYQESGRLESGAYAFRVPPTMPYVFAREQGRRSAD